MLYSREGDSYEDDSLSLLPNIQEPRGAKEIDYDVEGEPSFVNDDENSSLSIDEVLPVDPPAKSSMGRHLLGLVFVLLVVLMWVGSSELMQSIFTGSDSFNKPFFLTYLDCSLFLIYLFGFAETRCRVKTRWLHLLGCIKDDPHHATPIHSSPKSINTDSNSTLSPSTFSNSSSLLNHDDIIDDQDNDLKHSSSHPFSSSSSHSTTSSSTSSSTSTFSTSIPEEDETPCLSDDPSVALWRCIPSTDDRPLLRALRDWLCCAPSSADYPYFRHLAEGPQGLGCLSCAPARPRPPPAGGEREDGMWSAYTVAKVSALIMPFFFIANWLFNASLAMTSVASNTIISSTSGIWTLFVAVYVGVDRFSLTKLLAVCFSFGGMVLVGLSDSSDPGSPDASVADALVGDLLALISACTYASYAILMKRMIPDERRVSVFMFFGFLGLFSLLLMWPVFVILDLSGVEPFEWPPLAVLPALLFNALVGTVVSDLFWLAAVLLTSPLVTTLGTSLSVPVAMVLDYFLRGDRYPAGYSVGAGCVVVGFLLVNLDGYLKIPFNDKLSCT